MKGEGERSLRASLARNRGGQEPPARRVRRRVLLAVALLGTGLLGAPGCEPTGPCLGRNYVCRWDDECCSEFCNYWPHSDPRMGLCL